MKHTVKQINPSKVEITVEVEKELWKAAQDKAFDKVSSTVTVKGFRPGKAPKKLLEEHVNPQNVWNEAIDQILTPVFSDVVTEEKISPFMRPNVNITKLSPDDLTIVYTIVLAPSTTLGEYKGLSAKKVAPAVKDDEVNAAISKLLENNASLVSVEREAKMGDSVVLDFTGSVKQDDGSFKEFEGGAAKNYTLVLGSNQFVPGFEEALVGVKNGEKKEVKVTFPTAYVKELAGKEAVFACTIHEVKEKVIPELKEESVKELGIKDVDTIEKLKDYEKKSILEGKVRDSENQYYNDIIKQIVDGAKYEIADEIVDEEAAALQENLKKQIEQNGLSLEQYLEITGTKEEDLKKNFHEQAFNNIKGFLALEKVAESEKITVSDEDVDAEAKNLAAQYGMKEEDVKKYMSQDINRWKGEIRDRKVKAFILSVSK